jgi:hypothetical protein
MTRSSRAFRGGTATPSASSQGPRTPTARSRPPSVTRRREGRDLASLGRVPAEDASGVPGPDGRTSSSIDRLLGEARAGVDRVDARKLAAEIAAGALVVDTRPVEQRRRDGALPGAVVVDRNVLEWRLDPTSPHRLPQADDPGGRIIVVCNEGSLRPPVRRPPVGRPAAVG